MNALVLGAGGFIGSHMVKRLKSEGYWVRGVDLKEPEFSKSEADEFLIYDLRNPCNVEAVMRLYHNKKFSFLPLPFGTPVYFDEIYQFAADMGGAGYVFTGENDADIMHNSALINLNVLEHATTEKIFYSSSACIYPQGLQSDFYNPGLEESMAYPANPDSDYGWEKLFSERLYLAFAKNKGIDVRIARFHNIYGPEGTYSGGKEKAPAAICRKVVESNPVTYLRTMPSIEGEKVTMEDVKGNQIEIWGSGEQTRSFLYIDDCLDAVRQLMESDFKEPINIGSEEMISINRLAQMVINISGKDLKIQNIDGPQGVMGRNSDNTLIESVLGWTPKIDLKEGMYRLYKWIACNINVKNFENNQ